MKIFSGSGSVDLTEFEASDILSAAEEKAELSASLSEKIEESRKILLVLGRGIEANLGKALVEKCGDKLCFIALADKGVLADAKYSDKILNINPSDITDYKYFGVTNAKTPVLMHKSIIECDTVIGLADIGYDGLSGFKGVPGLIFPHLAPNKSRNAFWRGALDFSSRSKSSLCSIGVTKGNPLDKDIKEAIVSLSGSVSLFGINLVSAGGRRVGAFCGDMLLSYVRSCESYDSYNAFEIDSLMDGLVLETNKTCLQGILGDIEASVSGLMSGGRLLVRAPKTSFFGSAEFREFFNINSLEDVFDKARDTEFVKDAYDSFLLKKICSLYNIGIISPLERSDVIQCGMNPTDESGADEFLKNCSNTGKINNAARFTISG